MTCRLADGFGTASRSRAGGSLIGHISRVLRVTLLAPDIVEAILDRRQPEGLKLPRLMQPFSADWDGQRFHASASFTATQGPAPCVHAD